MQIELMDTKRLKIHLTEEELSGFSTDFDMLDYKNAETRELMWDLLALAKIQTGFESKNKRIYIEAFQTGDKGCTLYFTLLCDVKPGPKEAVAYEFEEFEDVLKAGRYMEGLPSSLYLLEDKYIFLLYGKKDTVPKKTTHALQEFGRLCGKGPLYESYLMEYGKPLLKRQAAQRLGEFFNSKDAIEKASLQ